jgi:hypothetical protein
MQLQFHLMTYVPCCQVYNCNITKDSHNGFDFVDLSSITHVAFVSMAAFKATALGEGPVATITSSST